MLTLLLSLTALATALLSGVFGMAGGMILMGVFAALLPVPTAMVMHGATQLTSNVSRAVILRSHVYWRGFFCYVAGSLLAYLAMLSVSYTPEPLVVFLGLGLTPFVAALLPRRWVDFERPLPAAVTGFQVAMLQLIAGAAGPLLDIAFVDTRLNRNQIVATKAATQVFSHSLKLAYFLPAVQGDEFSPQLIAAMLAATVAGTRLGTWLLERISEAAFKRYTRAIVYAIGGTYLFKAGMLLLH
ncbi:MAG TPA: sulfite exporter TauE/SafE family protein [Polyangiales bacterium]|nr:sulfite exporter TauE/SafE family protein [Polyangiales bacterium]